MKIKKALVDLSKKNHFIRTILRSSVHIVTKIKYMYYYFKYPVNDKVIFFESFNGNSYSCSPKAIYLEMLKDKRFKDYKFIWSFKDVEKEKKFFDNENTILIKKKSSDYYKYLSMSKYWIVNSLVDVAISKKKNQYYVQTWHGTPLKRLRHDIKVNGSALNNIKDIRKRNDKDAIRFDYFLSPSKFATRKFISAFNLKKLNKKDIMIEEGYPRNDYLFNYTKKDVASIKKDLNIPKNKKVILYAPTFRDNQHQSGVGYTYELGIDFNKMRENLSNEYVVLFRTHYFVSNSFNFDNYKGFIYNVSDYDDVNELYVISDLLITDYSSVFFDYANLKRPIYFYMYDLDEYKNNLRDFYIDLDELPGPIVKTEDDLIKKIKKQETVSTKKYKTFNEKYNYLDGKNCSKKVIDILFEDKNKIKKNKKEKILPTVSLLGIILPTIFLSLRIENLKINKLIEKGEIENKFSQNEVVDYKITERSKYRLNLRSVYGDIEAYHPKVLYFKNKWRGYHYWMVYTPFPKSDDSKENPHIAVSNDKINWKAPSKKVNPLDEPDERIPNKKYNSDGVIVYNKDKNELECYWRYVDDVNNTVTIYKKTTKDGINWSEKKEFLFSDDRQERDFLSPDIMYENGTYKIWYVDKNNTLKYTETTDGIEFTEPRTIKIEFSDKTKVWHIDVIKTKKGYEMLIVGYPRWKYYHYMSLYYTKSIDNYDYDKATVVLNPSSSEEDWDGQGIYKSSFIYEDGIYYVYYSAHNETIKGTGILFGKDITNLHGTNINYLEDKKAARKFLNLVKKGE